MNKTHILLIAIAISSFLFIRFIRLYVSLGELFLLLSLLFYPKILNYQKGSLSFKYLILLLILSFLVSELIAVPNIADAIVYLLRLLVFVSTFYICSFFFDRIDTKSMPTIIILIFLSLSFSSVLGYYFFRDGYLDILAQSGANLDLNLLWKFTHAHTCSYIVFVFLFITRRNPYLFALISSFFGFLNLYLDFRFFGVIFISASLFVIARKIVPRAKMISLIIIPSMIVLSVYLYHYIYSEGLVSTGALDRYANFTNQSSNNSGGLLNSLNRGSLNTTITQIFFSPIFGSGITGLNSNPFSLHSVIFFYWALWGLAFPFYLSKIMIFPCIVNFNRFLSTKLFPTAAPFLFLLFSILMWNLLFSPLASYRVTWGLGAAIIVSISPSLFLHRPNVIHQTVY